jgi:hypothetical protein
MPPPVHKKAAADNQPAVISEAAAVLPRHGPCPLKPNQLLMLTNPAPDAQSGLRTEHTLKLTPYSTGRINRDA